MNDFGFNDYNALFQRMYGPKPEKDKAGWLDPAMTLAGTLAGLPLGPAGMAAGAGLGHAVGGAASSAVNGDATGAIQGASGIPQAWQMFAPYIGTFESGGPVREGQLPLWMQMAAQQAATPQVTPQVGPDMAQGRQMLEQFAGPAPTPFQPREASHPTLEMLASIIPQVLDAMPKPTKPNNRAIGSWLPAMSAAIGAPAKYAQARRKAVNDADQETYDAQVEARNKFMAGAAPSVAGYLTREQKQTEPKTVAWEDTPMTEEQAIRITGDKVWTGKKPRDYNLFLEKVKAYKTGQASSGVGGPIDDRTKALGDAILAGTIPPSALGSRMTAQSRPLWEYLASQVDPQGRPYDVAKMVRDWEAGQKFIGAQNGRISVQQRGAAVTLFNTLNAYDALVDSVGKKVPQGANRPLNELIQVLGRNTNLYGPEANSALRQLSGADKTIVSELAQVLSAGGVPTDEARALAQQEVNQYWGKMPIKKAIQQIKHFTRIRLSSMINAAPLTSSSEVGDLLMEPDMWNPGGVPADVTAPPTTVTFRGEDGTILKIPADQKAKFKARFPRAVEVASGR